MYLKYRIKEAFYGIKAFLFPRQRWLTKKIPYTWIDKDFLWELVILEGIKHHVEQDNGLGMVLTENRSGKVIFFCDFKSSQNDPEYPDYQKQFDKELYDIYDIVVRQLPLLEQQLKVEWDKIPIVKLEDLNKTTKASYEATYGKVNALEKEIAELKTKVMVWAVTNRECIWT